MLDAWPVAHRETSVPTCQGETFVLTCGPENGPPVVLLHGGSTTSAMWARSMQVWAQKFRIHAIDIIGEPGFSAPSRPPLRSDAHARWLDDVWSAIGLDQAAIVGASFGGMLALDYAIRRPGKVRSLTLLAPAGIAPVRPQYVLTAVPLFTMGAWGRRRALSYLMGLPPSELTPQGWAFFDFFELVLQHARLRAQALRVFPSQQLHTLSMPVLAIMGGRDVVFNAVKMRHRLQTCVPHAQIVFLPDAGHGLTDQTAAVFDFLCTAEDGAAQR